MRIGIERGENRDEVLRIHRRNRSQRRLANRRDLVGQQIEQQVVDAGQPRDAPADAAERADGFEANLRVGRGVPNELDERFGRGWIANPSERTDGLDQHRSIAARQQRHQRRQRARILERAETLHGERARVRIRVFREREQGRKRARVLEPLQRERDRPPADARLTARIEHGRRERAVRVQSHERVEAEPERRRRDISSRVVLVAGRLRQGARLQD